LRIHIKPGGGGLQGFSWLSGAKLLLQLNFGRSCCSYRNMNIEQPTPEEKQEMMAAMGAVTVKLIKAGFILWNVENDATGKTTLRFTESGIHLQDDLLKIFGEAGNPPAAIDGKEAVALLHVLFSPPFKQ
jgi:hypothetical protein